MLLEMVNIIPVGQVIVSNASITQLPALVKAIKPSQGIRLKTLSSNIGVIYIGGSDLTLSTGFPMGPGSELFLPIANLNIVSFLAVTNNDVVAYLIT